MDEGTLEYKWFIIHTHSGFEAKVIESIKEEVRRFYIAEFGKWSISVTLFALIFLNIDVSNPVIFFGAFIFANLTTIFLHKLKT